MKNGVVILILAIALAIAGYSIYYRAATKSAVALLSKPEGEMEWLKLEYHLSDEQFARIQQLHREYAPKCDLMCDKITMANAKLDGLIQANRTVTPEVDAGLRECVAVQAECRRALLGHVYAVSAEMSSAEGARYIGMMKGRIIEPALGHDTLILKSAK